MRGSEVLSECNHCHKPGAAPKRIADNSARCLRGRRQTAAYLHNKWKSRWTGMEAPFVRETNKRQRTTALRTARPK
jgi:hypothetical protein